MEEGMFQVVELPFAPALMRPPAPSPRSRSSTLVILWLMQTRRWSLKQATDFVRECRPYINPNPGFLLKLGDFEVRPQIHRSFSRQTFTVGDLPSGSSPSPPHLQEKLLGKRTIRFPQDGKPITMTTEYEWLQADGTWKKRANPLTGVSD